MTASDHLIWEHVPDLVDGHEEATLNAEFPPDVLASKGIERVYAVRSEGSILLFYQCKRLYFGISAAILDGKPESIHYRLAGGLHKPMRATYERYSALKIVMSEVSFNLHFQDHIRSLLSLILDL